MRSQIWTDTDNNRAGMLPFVFDDSFGFTKYWKWGRIIVNHQQLEELKENELEDNEYHLFICHYCLLLLVFSNSLF
ncbi:hypothetical protein ACS0TY_013813 [Phlomoides rotata]